MSPLNCPKAGGYIFIFAVGKSKHGWLVRLRYYSSRSTSCGIAGGETSGDLDWFGRSREILAKSRQGDLETKITHPNPGVRPLIPTSIWKIVRIIRQKLIFELTFGDGPAGTILQNKPAWFNTAGTKPIQEEIVGTIATCNTQEECNLLQLFSLRIRRASSTSTCLTCLQEGHKTLLHQTTKRTTCHTS